MEFRFFFGLGYRYLRDSGFKNLLIELTFDSRPLMPIIWAILVDPYLSQLESSAHAQVFDL